MEVDQSFAFLESEKFRRSRADFSCSRLH